MERPAVVMDCGTGYTKVGFAGNVEPSDVFPTSIAYGDGRRRGALDDLRFTVGAEAARSGGTATTAAPLRQGMVTDWDDMERFWQQCIFRKLRVDPEEHNFLLTEPPMNPPENRERTAEVMFETFGVSGLYIGVQAVLALAGSSASKGSAQPLTGVVLDCGDGVSHVVPVVDGFVVGSRIKSMPIAGSNVTAFVQKLLRERSESIPPELSMEAAKQVKEKYSYVCSDMNKELAKHESDPAKYSRTHTMWNAKAGQEFSFSVGYERFAGPEIFFHPELYSPEFSTGLPELVDGAIQGCGIDSRRALYNNIVLSGGSTMYKDFGRRMQRDIKNIVEGRLTSATQAPTVNVVSHYNQRYAVWFGGSVLASAPTFPSACHTKADYEEHGPSICRATHVFREI
eukprot:jgi/Tetstr1/431951/TSEL_021428.t1